MAVDDSDTTPNPDPSVLPIDEVVRRLDRLWSDLPDQPASPLANLSGTPVGGYVIQRVIGRGAFGIVYKARDEQLGRDVALKIPRPEVLLDQEKLSRFEGEAIATASLDHSGIIPLFEAQLDGATPYLAYAYCPGPNLQQWLDESDGPLNANQAAQFVADLADALQYAHERGIVHRDLKPSNVLLNPTESVTADQDGHRHLKNFQPKLTDFGLARLNRRLEDTHSSMMVGTPLYMSPEQAECRNDDIGPWSDVFAMGAMLYHLLTGASPFAASSFIGVLNRLRDGEFSAVRDVRPDVDEDLATICEQCLRTDPIDRYQSAAELNNDLQRYLNSQPIEARKWSLARRLMKWAQRPARVAELMLTSQIISITRAVWGLCGWSLLAILSETTPTRAELSESLILVSATLPLEAWLIHSARRNAKGRQYRGTYLLVLLVCCCMFSMTLLMATGVVPTSLWYQRQPGARIVTFLLVSFLFFAQSVCWYLGDRTNPLTSFSENSAAGSNVSSSSKASIFKRLIPGLAAALLIVGTAFSIRTNDEPPRPGPPTSIALDGIDDHIVVDDVGFAEGQPFTLEAWIQPARSHRATAVAHGPVSIGVVAAGPKRTRVRISVLRSTEDIFLIDTDAVAAAGTWIHVAVTYDMSQLITWVNGIRTTNTVSLYLSETDDTHPAKLDEPLILRDVWASSPTYIGANNPTSYLFAGRIGEVRLSNNVFYRGGFTPVQILSAASSTTFLFHLPDTPKSISSSTTSSNTYEAKVVR